MYIETQWLRVRAGARDEEEGREGEQTAHANNLTSRFTNKAGFATLDQVPHSRCKSLGLLKVDVLTEMNPDSPLAANFCFARVLVIHSGMVVHIRYASIPQYGIQPGEVFKHSALSIPGSVLT